MGEDEGTGDDLRVWGRLADCTRSRRPVATVVTRQQISGTGYQIPGTPWGCPRLAGLGQTLQWTLRQTEL